MKKTLLLVILLLPLVVVAQRYRTVELKPITQQGWKYFYDLKKVSTPLALEIPLMALGDAEIDRFVKASKGWRTIGASLTILPLVYIISVPPTKPVDQSTFWWVFGGTIAAQLGCEAISHLKLGKAIDKYNYLILQPSGRSLGVQLTWKFL